MPRGTQPPCPTGQEAAVRVAALTLLAMERRICVSVVIMDKRLLKEREMKASVITEFGGPEVLQVREVPIPEPGPGQVAIRVAYAEVNYAETMARRIKVDPLPDVYHACPLSSQAQSAR
jgi:hypothetical protein